MRRLLIADSSEPFTAALKEALCGEFEICVCRDGRSTLECLPTFHPDAMILNLMLPHKDGLTVLQETAYVPKAILAVTSYSSPYVEQAAGALGVGCILLMPCINAVCVRLMDLLHQNERSQRHTDLQGEIAVHLHALNFSTRLNGYQQLCIGIPLFFQDPNQRLTKELYPAIARLCDCSDGRTVEHSIRCAIVAAWKSREDAVWSKYFPPDSNGRIPCPSNKCFISRLAEFLNE